MVDSQLLKKDLFGEIRKFSDAEESYIVRDSSVASAWLRWLARWLLRREARALAALGDIDGIPQLLRIERERLTRTYLPGLPLHRSKTRDPGYFKEAARLLRTLHRLGVVHNDLAKEPNLLVGEQEQPAFIDFQLAWFAPQRNRLFRVLAYEDLRHLLKHKRSYCPAQLTQRELSILEHPSMLSRAFMATVKPVYLLITRRLLGWADREGAADRSEHS